MMELFVSGCAVFTSAIILKYHGEPRYRFAAAVLSVGGWTLAAAVALPEKWQCDQINKELKNIIATRADRVADEPQAATLVGVTPGGNILEVKSNGVRNRDTGSTERGTVLRWGGTWSGSGYSSLHTGDGETVRSYSGSRGL